MFKRWAAVVSVLAACALGAGSAHAEGEAPKFGRHEVWSKAHAAADAATQSGDLDAARRELETAFGEAVRFAEGDPRLEQSLKSLRELAEKLLERGDPKPLEALYAKLGALADAAGATATAVSVEMLLHRSELAGRRDDPASAEQLAHAAHDRAEARFGPIHASTLSASSTLIEAVAARDPRRAIPLAEEYVALLREALGPNAERVVGARVRLALLHQQAGRPERARELAREALAEIAEGENLGARAGVQYALAMIGASLGDYDDAEENARAARSVFELGMGPTSDAVAQLDGVIAAIQFDRGDLQAAFDLTDEIVARIEAGGGGESARLIGFLGLQARMLIEQEKLRDAELVLKRAIAIGEHSGELGASQALGARWTLADLRSRKGSIAESEAIHAELFAKPADTFDARLRRCSADNQLAYAYARMKRHAEALPIATRALACMQEMLGADDPGLAPVFDTLGWAQLGTGDVAGAGHSFETVLRMLALRPHDVFSNREIWGHVAALERKRGDAAALAKAESELARIGREIRLDVVRKKPGAFAAAASDENAAGNYRFALPAGWQRFSAGKLNESASAYARRDPVAFFTIAANALPAGASVPLDELAAGIAKGISANVADAELLRSERHAVNGIEGLRLVLRAEKEAQQVTFVVWVVEQAGALYQLTFWAPQGEWKTAGLLASANEVFAGFSVLDPNRGGTHVLGELTSERFGYRVKLHGKEWHAWENQAEEVPHAERGALFGNDGALAVVPVTLGGFALDLATVASGLDNMVSPADFSAAASVRVDGTEGREIEFSHADGNRRFWYRMRAFERGGAGFLVAVWTHNRDADARARIFEAIEGFSLLDGPDPPSLDSLTPAERSRQALFFNDAGITALQRGRVDVAIGLLESALQLTDDDPMPLRNLAYAMLEANRPRDLLDRLAKHEERVLGDAKLRAFRARARELVGDTDGAIADYGAAIEAGADDEQLDQRYVDLLLAADRGAEARAHVDARAEKSGSVALRRLRASVLRETGDPKSAARELEALRKLRPADTDILFELARTQAALGDHAAVIASCDAILKSGPSSFAHYLKAHAQAELADYAGAKKSIEAALAIEPDSEEAKTFLAHVSAALGEGENSALKEPLEPVALPEDLRAWMEAGARAVPESEHETRDLWRVKGVQYTRGRELRTTLWLKVDVRDQRSIEQLSRLEFDFHPLWEKVFVNSLVVRDAKGKELAHGRASDAYVLDPLQDEQATSKRRLYVPVRGLAVGTTLELVLTRLESGEPERFTYLDEALSLGIPIERAALFVTGDLGELVWRASPGVAETKRDGRVEWRSERPLVDRWEPLQPTHKGYLPSVRVADSHDSWPGLVRDYLKDLSVFEQPDAKLAELAQEQTRGLATPDDKARALARFVQRTLSYQAIEFGRRARIPNAAEDVLEKKFGDCKDHALLLHQLLMGAGIDSRLALASFRNAVEPELPSLDQFDHMIVRCLGCRDARWLDATDKGLDLGSDAPRGLAGNSILLLEQDDPRLEAIPAPVAAPHRISSERTVKLGDDGSLSVDERIDFSGYPAAWIRDFLRNTDRATWKEAMRNVLLAEHDIVRSVDVENLDRAGERLELHLAYDVRSAFSRAGEGWVGRAPIAWEEQLLNLAQVEKRQSPVEFDTPFRFESRLRLEPPTGFALRASPLGAAERGGAFTRLHGDLKPDGRALVMHFEIARSSVAGPAARYAELDRESSDVFDYLRQSFELQRVSE